MRLSARILEDVSSVNVFNYGTYVQFTEGDAPQVFIQLIDLNKDSGLKPPGRRYVPASGSTLTAVIGAIDDANVVTKTCVQVYPTTDPSIWRIDLQTTDELVGTLDMKLTLVEPTKTTYGYVASIFRIDSTDRTH